ncbi:hypothetical protein EIP86_007592 [Pleurotus ostreatoroseus]|nr:hypothetical protein EIP86_007592 [Pleurotus ostreatoroseus]
MPTLADLVASLSLKQGPVKDAGSASGTSIAAMMQAGFWHLARLPDSPSASMKQYDSTPQEESSSDKIERFGPQQPPGYLLTIESRSAQIVKNLRVIHDLYFSDNARPRVIVQMDPTQEHPRKLDFDKLTTQPRWVNAWNRMAIFQADYFLGSDSPFMFLDDPAAQVQAKDGDLQVPMLRDDQKDPSTLKSTLSWFTALHMNAEPDGDGQFSERSVEHLIGGSLHKILSIPDCHVLSGRKLNYPDELKLSVHKEISRSSTTSTKAEDEEDSSSTLGAPDVEDTLDEDFAEDEPKAGNSLGVRFADNVQPTRRSARIASRPASSDDSTRTSGEKADSVETSPGETDADGHNTSSYIKHIIECYPDICVQVSVTEDEDRLADIDLTTSIRQLLEPVIAVGEAKRVSTGEGADPQSSRPYYVVQLASAAHPALVLLTLLPYKGELFNIKNRAPLKKNSFIYSIYYDEFGLIIVAQFPYYLNRKGERGWRFAQIKIKEFEFSTWARCSKNPKEAARLQTEFAIALHVVREHMKGIRDVFRSKAYTDLVKKISAASEA